MKISASVQQYKMYVHIEMSAAQYNNLSNTTQQLKLQNQSVLVLQHYMKTAIHT
jgi:hypothetical protein